MDRRRAVQTLACCSLLPVLGWSAAGRCASPAQDGDVWLEGAERRLLGQLDERLQRLEALVGNANFNLIGHAAALRMAAGYRRVGAFSRAERDLLERLFYRDATEYGFLGPRLVAEIDYRIVPQDRQKVWHSGHYLFKDRALPVYQRLRRDVGDTLILTSGIRGVVKQTHLFIGRVRYDRGNLSRAARSVAPPAYSYHSVGDFDIGQSDFGYENFTDRFADSEVYRRLRDLDYVRNRYDRGNRLGMRFEPWHVEVA